MTDPIDLKNFSLSELEELIMGLGKEKFRARQLFKWLYQKRATSFEEMTDLAKDFRQQLASRAVISTLEPEEVESSADGSRKYLFRLDDGEAIESVLIPEEDRSTLCISSQVGCAMACAFCLTGTFTLRRNLTTAEIINQVLAVSRTERVSNIVFMGMGEPLANLDNVVRALNILTHPDAFQLSTRKVTVSTSGLV
ncbi:MAG TPA: 23S rRNA (adenine(2503)-C(2))-methyltransferase RlmN, partial [Geobacterales bacterium]|nr:23S rRNA (adenine(2503)-C(2))-methyltransferase RlmN [Geobacterales bacterium]